MGNEDEHRKREDERLRSETETRNTANIIKTKAIAETMVYESREKAIRAEGYAEAQRIREQGRIQVEKIKLDNERQRDIQYHNREMVKLENEKN